jgi:tyrosyl-tRNA synthetase
MDKVEELLTRGVENIIPSKKELEKLLRSEKKLSIYLGIDPTATKIHIGHAVPLRKLQQFVELGHSATFLIGDFTALIGDTSDKNKERPALTRDQIRENFVTYKSQAEKFLDFSKVALKFNSEWLSKLSFEDIIKLTRHFSAGDFYSRELIKSRLTHGDRVGLQEVLYPAMQGYDSYFMDTDIQLGGTDQTFNMQAGRTLQKDLRGKQSFVIANGFLEGTDGLKMSKTGGNAIWIEDKPDEIYGKIMSLRDDLITQYFLLGTNLSLPEVNQKTERLKSGENPMVLKKELAHQIVAELHSREEADQAKDHFAKVFSQRDFSDLEIPTLTYKFGATISSVLLEMGIVSSKSEYKRLAEPGAIDVNGQVTYEDREVKPGDVIQAGKKKFLKIV